MKTTMKHFEAIKKIYDVEKAGEIALSVIDEGLVRSRLDDAIEAGKAVISGEIKEPEKVICDTLFPPGGMIRADLQRGSMRLYYGDSCDCSYILYSDFDSEIKFILSAHLEDGIPVDWWFADYNDEVMKRKHMKYGYSLKDIPKKIKNKEKCSKALIQILKDVRNERNPQFKRSDFSICLAKASAAWNLGMEISNFEILGLLYDGLKNGDFVYYPMPPSIRMMLYTSRVKWIRMTANIMTEGKLVTQRIHSEWLSMTKNEFPEVFEYMGKMWENGIDCPSGSLRQNSAVRRKIYMEDLKAESVDDAYAGYFLDVDEYWDGNEVKIISKGYGKNAEIY